MELHKRLGTFEGMPQSVAQMDAVLSL
jgi:hypothetical protein